MFRKSLDFRLNPEQASFAFFPNTSTYAPILYLPQSLAILSVKFFNPSPLILLYAARLFNLFSWTILIYFAVIFSPVYKWLFVLLALTPMSVFQAASMSPDALTNGAAFCFISIIFRLALDKNASFRKLDLFILILLLMFLTLSRYAYGFLCILFFMIPVKKFHSLQNYLKAAAILFIVTFLTLLTGGLFVKHIYDSVDPAVSYYGGSMDFIHPYSQWKFMITHVVFYLKTLLMTIWTNKLFIHSFIGQLGWLDTPVPHVYIWLAVFTLIVIGLFENDQNMTIDFRKKLIILISICSVIFAINILLYLSWTPVGSAIIEGFQGRYLIPFAPLIFSLFYNRKLKLPEKRVALISIGYILISFLVMNYSLIARYYIVNAQ